MTAPTQAEVALAKREALAAWRKLHPEGTPAVVRVQINAVTVSVEPLTPQQPDSSAPSSPEVTDGIKQWARDRVAKGRSA